MSVGRICNRSVVTVKTGETVRDAARRMADQNVGTLLVLSDGQEPLGIITDRDIAIRCVAAGLDPEGTRVARVMTSPIRMVNEDLPIEEALAKMAEEGVRRIAVTDYDGKLAGILSLDDVLELLVEEAETIGRLLAQPKPTVSS